MAKLTDFTFAFEMATGSTPRTSAPSYTALTTYVMAGEGMSLTRGRQSEQDATAQPGRATVKLRNTDGRFTMNNGSSPYAPLQLRRPCRFRVTYSATTYDLWQGFVDDWGNGREELTGVARLSLSDRAARAAKIKLPTAVVGEFLSDSPAFLYPLWEPEGSTTAGDVAGKGAPALRLGNSGPTGADTTTFGVTALIGPEPTSAVSFSETAGVGGQYLYNAEAISGSLTMTAGSLDAFIRIAPGAPDNDYLVMLGTATLSEYVAIKVESSAGFALIQFHSGTDVDITTPVSITDGNWHHVAVRWATSGTTTVNVLVDGVAEGSGSVTSSASALTLLNVGGIATDAATGQVAMVAAYTSDIGSAALARHAAALTSWSPETTTARFNRLARNSGLPSAFYATTGTTDTVMGPQPTEGVSLLDALGECAKAEGGVLYVSDTGVLTLATSTTRYNTAVGVTLDATKAGQVDADTELPTNDQDLINDSSATRYGGPTFRTTDATSIDAYDLHDESETLYLALDAHALNWTQWRVAQFADPAPRLNEVPVDVVSYATSGGTVANLLNADIGTKLRITNLPSDVAASSTLDLMIEGIKDDIGSQTWVRTFTTSPIGLNDTPWILGTDLLGVGTVLGY